MATKGGSNGVWHDEPEGHCFTFITSLLCESAKQKAGSPRKYEGSWLLLLR